MKASATLTLNRRLSPRAPLPIQAQLVIEGEIRDITVDDVSEGGLRIVGLEKVDLHMPFKIFLPIRRAAVGRQRLCLLEGKPVWRFGEHTGIAFVDLDEETKQELRDYVHAINSLGKQSPSFVATLLGSELPATA